MEVGKMEINDLKENQSDVNMQVKVIYDKMLEKEWNGRKTKSVVVVDSDKAEGGTTALLDLFDEDIGKFKFGDKMDLVNCFAKKITTNRGEQMVITYGYDKASKELIGHYEKAD